MPSNYYTYDETSNDITSPVVSLSFQDKSNEETITVSNLNKHIEYFLSVPEALPESEKFSVNVRENAWVYHKLAITSNDQAVSIEVAPFNCSHQLQVYVQENIKPTKEKYSWKKVIWQPSRENRTNVNYTECFDENTDYTLFLSNTEVRKFTYIIGIWYEDGKEEKQRHADETVQMKYSIRVYQSKCLYWNESTEKWMGDGCVVSIYFICFLLLGYSTECVSEVVQGRGNTEIVLVGNSF